MEDQRERYASFILQYPASESSESQDNASTSSNNVIATASESGDSNEEKYNADGEDSENEDNFEDEEASEYEESSKYDEEASEYEESSEYDEEASEYEESSEYDEPSEHEEAFKDEEPFEDEDAYVDEEDFSARTTDETTATVEATEVEEPVLQVATAPSAIPTASEPASPVYEVGLEFEEQKRDTQHYLGSGNTVTGSVNVGYDSFPEGPICITIHDLSGFTQLQGLLNGCTINGNVMVNIYRREDDFRGVVMRRRRMGVFFFCFIHFYCCPRLGVR
jgi:hypothetical protein